ncbi:MAG TPA: adenylate/guanylate cyclase domain-containing protein [Gaiellaceae bacterium]
MAVSRRTVTVLFADVAESTPLGERLDPESLRRVMSRYFEAMETVLESHGGTVEKFIGDAVMAVFGLPELHEDDALRAVRAATDFRLALADLNDELERELGVRIGVRVGINTGEVVAGDGTGGQKLVTGDAVNVAKRFEEAARTGEILIGDSTRRLVENAAVIEPRDPLALKGKSQPIVAWSVNAVIAEAPGYARRMRTPLVGRERELRALREAFEDALSGRTCRLVTILGSAGIGKSRLTAELWSSLDGRARLLYGPCLPYGNGITFWPLVRIVGMLGGDEGVHEELGDADDAELIADRVLGAVGATPVSSAGGEMFWAVRRLLEEAARRQPLLIVIEDIHWAEPKLLDLLEYLAGWTDNAPILLVCLARPDLLDERPSWLGGSQGSTILRLGPLTDAESELLLSEIGGEWELDAEARARITEAAEGNPLYVEQMAAMIAEGGPADAIPPSINALLAARLDRLPSAERSVLERAAVAGKDVTRRTVLHLSPQDEHADIDAVLLSLVRKEFLSARPGREDAYRFKHVLIREAAYAGIPKRLRAELHERYGDHAAGTAAGRAGELDEIVGYHLEQALRFRAELGPLDEDGRNLAQRAFELLASAGRRALERGDSSGAANLLGRALALEHVESPDRLGLMIELSEALYGAGRLSEAQSVLDETTAAAEATDDPRIRARSKLESAWTQLHTWDGTLDPLIALSDEVASVFEATGDDAGLSRALTLKAYVTFIRCRMVETEEIVERALRHARPSHRWRLLHVRVATALRGPTPVTEAIARCEAIRTENDGDLRLNAFIEGELAVLEAMRGRFDVARALAAEAQRVLQDLGLTLVRAVAQHNVGVVELLAGDSAAAVDYLRGACNTMEEIGERGNLSSYAGVLARALLDEGEESEADHYARLSEETTLAEDILSQVLWRDGRARLLCRSGDLGEARELAEEAVTLAEQTDDLNLTGSALATLGAVLTAANDVSEAAAAYDRASALFERKGNTVSARHTRELAGDRALRS